MIHTLLTFWKSFWNWQPLSLRGLLAAVVATLALKFIAVPEMDLVTFALAGPVLFFVLLSAILSCFFGARLKKRIKAEVNYDKTGLQSNTIISFGMLLQGSSVPTFFTLIVSREFDPENAESRDYYLKGREPALGGRRVVDTIRFAHRGVWNLKSLHFELIDPFGFCSRSWSQELNRSLAVSPPSLKIRPLPVIASSSKAGDEMSLPKERTGDLFDIKQYDPADGVSRILWKTYARTQELYVRRPEPAIIPEGEVAIYLVAGKYEDHVAAAALSYIDYLISNDIVVLFGTDGSSLERRFASNWDDIMTMVQEGATSENAGTAKDFASYLNELSANNREMKQFVLFSSKADEQGSLAPSWFPNVNEVTNNVGSKVSLAQVPQSLAPRFWNLGPQSEGSRKGIFSEIPLLENVENYVMNYVKSHSKNLGRRNLSPLPSNADYLDVESDENYASR
jgi:hypothetical protein